MPVVVSRWHFELSKYFLPARNDMLSAEHGAFETSSVITILPWLVSSVIWRVPLCGTLVSGGGPVLTSFGFFGFCASPCSAGFAVQVHFAGPRLAAAAGAAGLPPPVSATMTATTAPI